MKQSKRNKIEIRSWLDNFFTNAESFGLDPNKKYTITDVLKLMPEECGREFLRLGDAAYNYKGPGYDQIMNRKE